MNYYDNAINQYKNATHLQNSTSSYLLMFESLIQLNIQGRRAYDDQNYANEFESLEKMVRIAIGMRALFNNNKHKASLAMHTFFDILVNECTLFNEFEDRHTFYDRLYDFITHQHTIWKNVIK